MSGLTNHIERFLKSLLEESEGHIEIRRNELAEHFGCAPSQINYVLSTRFTPYKGYFIESRRGGSGYVKIVKVTFDSKEFVQVLLEDTIGDTITKNKAILIVDSLLEEEVISEREALIMTHALEDSTLSKVNGTDRNTLRSDILKNMILALLR
ncbi:MAG: CtsR family transcriptional regulator [Tissierellia bacterium]|nr:CtsR family transcriptional regulator [Tissierellia bacterium]